MSNLLYGLRLVRVAALDADGKVPTTPEWKTITTAQQFNITPQVQQGQSVELRGGDRLLATIQEKDKTTGMDITLQDAAIDLEVLPILVGGTYVPANPGPPAVDEHWIPAGIDEESPGFIMEMYVARYAEGNQHSSDEVGYSKYVFNNCSATGPQHSHQDRQFASPQFTIKARDNQKETEPEKQRYCVHYYVAALPT